MSSLHLSLSHLLFAIPVLLLIEGLFSGAEIALLSVDKITLKKRAKEGSASAALALQLISRPERIFSTTLLMTCLCVIGISSLVAIYIYGNFQKHQELISIAISSPLVVFLGELIPKTLYRKHAERIVTWAVYPVEWAYYLFYPVTRLLSLYTNRLSRLVIPMEELLTGRKRTTREELLNLISYTKRDSEIKTSEKQMIKRIFEFKETEAKHALIPLVKVDAIEISSTVQEALKAFEIHRHSRLPVYQNRVDNIVGILEVYDLFPVSDLGRSIQDYIKPAQYAAANQSLEDVLSDLYREQTEMAIIVDEHGGAQGILTFEDIVEEIVGEISDEYDSELQSYKALNESSWLVPARLEVSLLNDELKFEIPEGDYETLSGFLLQQFGRIPENGDELYFDTPAGSFKFTIRSATQRYIETVLVEKIPQ